MKITIPVPSTRSSFSPAPTLSNGIETERKYILIELGTFTSATTAPSIGDIFLRHHDAAVVWTNFTTNANGALTDGTFTGAPATVFYPEGSIRYHVFPFIGYGLDHTIHRAIANIGTWEREYLATDDTWKALTGYTDTSNDFENGPTTLGDPTQAFTERFDVPSDWTEKTVSLPLVGGGTISVTGYFTRQRLTSVTTLGPTAPPLVRSRVRAFGNANTTGMEMLTSTTIKGAIIKGIGMQSAAATIQLFNLSSGAGRSISIPNAPTLPLLVDFADITFAAGERIGLAHSSGGTLTSFELYLLV